VLQRLVGASEAALRQPELRSQLDRVGIEQWRPMSQPELARYMVQDMDKWARLVKVSGAQVD
jgi:tripartite-type tricarboxylate transporter receptor subunit TctC